MRDNELMACVSAFGTPLYVYDERVLRSRVAYLRGHLPEHVELCYAMKANTFVVPELQKAVDCLEVCSPGELRICGELGIPQRQLVISGVYKDEATIDAVVGQDVPMRACTVESPSQLDAIASSARRHGRRVPVLLRLTSGSQFGMDASVVRDIVRDHVGPIVASSIALFCVWVANGLWHGAGSQYLFYGMYYFVLIVLGDFAELAGRAASKRFGINRTSLPYRTFQLLRTLVIIFVGELFFRADGLWAGLDMFSRMVGSFNPASLFDGTALGYGLDAKDFAISGVILLGVLVVDILKERGREPGRLVVRRPNFALATCVALVMRPTQPRSLR